MADYKVRLIGLFEHDIEFHFVQRAVTKAWMAGRLAADKDTKTSVVTGDKLSDLTGDALREKIVEEYGERAVLEVEKAYLGETGNWRYDDWRYHMYLYAASDPTERATESGSSSGKVRDCERLNNNEKKMMSLFGVPKKYNGVFINDMRMSAPQRHKGVGIKVVNKILRSNKTYMLEPVEDGKTFWKKFKEDGMLLIREKSNK